MNLMHQRARLQALARSFQSAWDDTKGSWRDQRAEAFEREVMEPLEPAVTTAVKSLEKLEGALARIRSECGENEDV
jgi:hypothetical protein